jgi:hypothetical protein
MKKRGQLTNKVQHIALRALGREISQTELRLIPYIQYLMVNEQRIDGKKINREEVQILNEWQEESFIEWWGSQLKVSKHFWAFMCDCLYEAYVDRS